MEGHFFLLIFASVVHLINSGENLSYGKPTRQSSPCRVRPDYVSGNAVDGCTDVKFDSGCCTCQNDTEGNTEAWWQVDLESVSVISDIIIYYRIDHTSYTFPGVEIYLSNETDWTSGIKCYNHTKEKTLFYYVIVKCEGVARYVTLQNNRYQPIPQGYSNVALLELCEVEVNGCNVGSFGTPCFSSCPADCGNGICHPETGECYFCVSGKYGRNCQENCSYRCRSNVCDKSSGFCSDCDPGKYGQTCIDCEAGCTNGTCDWFGHCHDCVQGFYGKKCKETCVNECKDSICNRSTGICDECKEGYYGSKCNMNCLYSCKNGVCNQNTGYCDACEDGQYGSQCANCSSRCLGVGCDQLTGACTRCSLGYYGDTCHLNCTGTCKNNVCNRQHGYCDECDPGKYGTLCYECPDVCENKLCEHETGICVECRPGRFGPGCNGNCFANCRENKCNRTTGYCDDCDEGKYGTSCIDCPKSCGGPKCDQVTGRCNNCSQNMYGDMCDKTCPINCKEEMCERNRGVCLECDDGYFTNGCNRSCPQHCDNNVCNISTGFCDECQPGKYGFQCQFTCPEHCLHNLCDMKTGACSSCIKGRYGSSCQLSCPVSCHDGVCDVSSGVCKECPKGRYGRLCDKTCTKHCHDHKCDQETGKCASCIPGKHGDSCKQDCMKYCATCHQKTAKCEVCKPGKYGSSCTSVCGQCSDGLCDMQSGSCRSKCKKGWKGTACNEESEEEDESDKSGVYVGVSIAAILFIIIGVGLLIILCRLRRKEMKESFVEQEEASIEIPVMALQVPIITQAVSTSSIASERIYCNTSVPGTLVSDLRKMVTEKQQNEALIEEFSSLPKGAIFSWTIGAKPCYKEKNRFKSVYPYDHSRVVLDVIDNDAKTDYINASYIDSVDTPKAYVAAQGPKADTVDDFWRMVWQLKCGKIVMVTNLVEGIKTKCERYWPEKEESLSCAHFELNLDKELTYSFYVMRKIILKKKKTQEEREVYQFHFTSWPDHGVPDTIDLVLFHQRIRNFKVKEPGPLVVHCSAGVGRTGTYIALDAIYDSGEKTGMVDIFNYLKIMRKCRVAMVQTQEQYDIIHFALIEAFELPKTTISKSNYSTEYERRTKNDDPKNQNLCYKEFQMLEVIHSQQAFQWTGSTDDEKLDEARRYTIYSRSYIPGMPDELDAVNLQTFTDPRGFIVTKTPNRISAEDFWHIVMDYDCTTIIHLSITDNEVKGSLWLPHANVMEFEGVSVSHTDDLKHSGNISVSQYKVCTTKYKAVLYVKVIKAVNWPGQFSVPTANDALQLLETLDQEISPSNPNKILVTCSDGSSQSGLFCLLYNLRNQLKMDDEVDIYQATRRLQHRKKDLISRYEQYKFCYDVIKSLLMPS